MSVSTSTYNRSVFYNDARGQTRSVTLLLDMPLDLDRIRSKDMPLPPPIMISCPSFGAGLQLCVGTVPPPRVLE